MRWLIFVLLAACALLSAGCGCSAGVFSPGSSVRILGSEAPGGLVVEAEYPQLAAINPSRSGLDELVFPGGEPVVPNLPPLPDRDAFLRSPSGLVHYNRVGSDTFLDSTNAVSSGNSMVLGSSPGAPAWAVYEVAGVSFHNGLTQLEVSISNGNFSGKNPGYWVGVANYQLGSWVTLGLVQDDFQQVFNASSAYKDRAGSIFVYVAAADGQSVIVNQIGLEVNDPQWTEVEVATGPNTGRTPAIAFLQTGNPIVVYSDYQTSDPMWAVGVRSLGLGDESAWATGTIDMPPSPVIGHWLDVAVDPISGSPVVSFINSNTGSGATNSEVGYAIFGYFNGSWAWAGSVRPVMVDTAEYTSIAFNPITGMFELAYCMRNQSSTAPDFDMDLLHIDIGNPDDYTDDSLFITPGFSSAFASVDFRYPHVAVNPATGKLAVCIEGGYVVAERIDEDGWWLPYSEADSGPVGSIDYSPVSYRLGQSFAFNSASDGILNFVDYNSSMLGVKEAVDVIPVAGDEQIGSASQLVFAPDGTPGVVYTENNGFGVYINYAYHDGSAWVVESVSDDSSYPDGSDRIHVDLAFDDTGLAAVCYNHVNSSSSSLRVALRGV